VEEYDRRSLFFMLLKCYHALHLVIEFETMKNQLNDVGSCLGEPIKDLENRELQMFKKVDKLMQKTLSVFKNMKI
jgi:hypothetical protein